MARCERIEPLIFDNMTPIKTIIQAALAHAHTERGHGNTTEAEEIEAAVAKLNAKPKAKKKLSGKP